MAARYKKSPRRGYYIDEEGDTFKFGWLDEREGTMELYYPWKRKMRKISIELVQAIEDMHADDERRDQIKREREREEKQAQEEIEKMKNAYRPGGIMYWITKSEFKRRQEGENQ